MPRTRSYPTADDVLKAIMHEASAGEDLSYQATLRRNRRLLRSAEREFTRWSDALAAAGVNYAAVRKQHAWTRDRVLERIRFWNAQGADLCLSNMLKQDSALVSAALHRGRFACWSDALAEAGFDPKTIMHGQRWTPARIERELVTLKQQGVALTHAALTAQAPRLLTAIYRHIGSLADARDALNGRGATITERCYARRAGILAELALLEKRARQQMD